MKKVLLSMLGVMIVIAFVYSCVFTEGTSINGAVFNMGSDKAELTVSCENLPENAELYGAVYNGEGVLLAASKINDYTAEFDASDIELAQSVKIFAWDGADTMRPLCAAYEGDIVLRDNKVYYSKRAVIDQAGNVYAAIGDVMYIYDGTTVTEVAGGGTIGNMCMYGDDIYYINQTFRGICALNLSTLESKAIGAFDVAVEDFVIYGGRIYASDEDYTMLQSISLQGGEVQTIFAEGEKKYLEGWGISEGRLVVLTSIQNNVDDTDSADISVIDLYTGQVRDINIVNNVEIVHVNSPIDVGTDYAYCYININMKGKSFIINLKTGEVSEQDGFYTVTDPLPSEYIYDGWEYLDANYSIWRKKDGVTEKIMAGTNSKTIHLSDMNSSKMLYYKYEYINGKYSRSHWIADHDGSNPIGIVSRYDGVVTKYPNVSGSQGGSSGGDTTPQTCSKCGGGGMIQCTVCGGAGGHYITMLGQQVWQGCATCGQSGQMVCTECGGSGQV